MPNISILPEEIRSKIAAGEIVERPASVVKELIENAFDAKADFIKIILKEGGIREISVYDNGEGIEPEDLQICYKHFATSKIKSLSDIFKITTFGFRGEALASISQVSNLTITSKHKNYSSAYEIRVNYGKEIYFKPAQLNKGTLVKVENLFSNLPARKSFLKSSKTELLKSLEIIKGLMFCYPENKYEIISINEALQEKKLLFWEGGKLKELISFLFQIEEKNLNEVTLENPPYSVYLILTNISQIFTHTKYLYILVNKRWVRDEKLNKLILSALKIYYGNLGFPAGVILIRAPYHLVDVNVHPAKWEVRFKNEKAIFNTLNKALENLFHKKNFYYKTETDFSHKIREDLSIESSHKIDFLKEKSFILSSSFKKPSYKYLGSFLNTYLLVEINNELYIIDQHALSERIIFEELKLKFNIGISQPLLIPILIKISDSALQNFEEKNETLKKIGFELELIKNNEIIVKKIPSIFKENIKELLEKILEEDFFESEQIEIEILKRYACILARKKGEIMSENEITYLIEKFLKEKLHFCPHGRPLYFKLSLEDIEKALKRK